MCTATLKTEALQGDANQDAGHLSRIAEGALRLVKKWLKQVLYDRVPCYNEVLKHEELTVWTGLLTIVTGSLNFVKMTSQMFHI